MSLVGMIKTRTAPTRRRNMGNHQTEYLKKLIPAEEVVKTIKSGDWIDYGNFQCAPITLDIALSKRASELKDVKVRAVGFPGLASVATADPDGKSFCYNNWHFTAGDRILHDKGCCSYIPILYHEGAKCYGQDEVTSDAFIVRTASMDSAGYFNFGIANSLQKAQADKAKKVIVEINANMPYCFGGYSEGLHISEVDYVVETENRPLVQLGDPKVSDADRAIANLVVNQIPDGACLQLGIGGMPNVIGRMIADSDLKNLGVHTEMLVDSFVDMYDSGRITNSMKKICPGKMVYTFALGSTKLYEFLHLNPGCASYPVDFVNKPEIIAKNDRVVSINNAVEVDLFGQVSSESSGFRQISGTGGQFDYHYAAFHSEGGKGFICLTSTITDKHGNKTSRIRPHLNPGTIVTLPRTAVHYVVTEFGMACLKAKSTWQRAEALIEIAHPDFQEELIKEAEKMGIWKAANKKDAASLNIKMAG